MPTDRDWVYSRLPVGWAASTDLCTASSSQCPRPKSIFTAASSVRRVPVTGNERVWFLARPLRCIVSQQNLRHVTAIVYDFWRLATTDVTTSNADYVHYSSTRLSGSPFTLCYKRKQLRNHTAISADIAHLWPLRTCDILMSLIIIIIIIVFSHVSASNDSFLRLLFEIIIRLWS